MEPREELSDIFRGILAPSKGERSTTFMNDMLLLVQHFFQAHFRAADENVQSIVLNKIVGMSMEFAQQQSLHVSGKTHTKWSTLRPALRTVMLDTMEGGQAVSAEVGNQILGNLNQGED